MRPRGHPALPVMVVAEVVAVMEPQEIEDQEHEQVLERVDANRAALSVARKLARRSHHILRRLGDQAWTPIPATR